MKKVIFFDFDGTIIDSNKIKEDGFTFIYKDFIKSRKKILSFHRENMGLSRYDKFEYINKKIICINYNKKIGEEYSNLYSKYIKERIVRAPFVDGAISFLKKNSENKYLVLFSITPYIDLIDFTNKLEISRYFRKIYGYPSKKIDVVKEEIKINGFAKKDIIIIGDSFSDLTVAETLNIDFIGIKSKNSNLFDYNIKTFDSFNKIKLNF